MEAPTATTIDLAFRFVEDAIEGTVDLNQMPDQAELAFREITVKRHDSRYRLTASRANGANDWIARVTGCHRIAGASTIAPRGRNQLAGAGALQASGTTPDAAFSSLAAKLRILPTTAMAVREHDDPVTR